MDFAWNIIFRCIAAVAVGALIGGERAKHGRVAGMRTHILVCLGSALTSMTGLYVNSLTAFSGDPFRISAQVISGVGFLGAGMIILKNDNTISGLTTAAGVWTTATIGVALGYGFYLGSAVATLLLLVSIVFFARFEKKRKQHQYIYVELMNAKFLNQTLEQIKTRFSDKITYKVLPAKCMNGESVGLEIDFKNSKEDIVSILKEFDNIVFAIEEHE